MKMVSSRGVRWSFLFAGVFLGFSVSVRAQNPAKVPPVNTVNKFYRNQATFYLPIHLDERQRSEVREVQLYAKESPQSTWILKDRVPPTQNSFTFRAPRDGEYWFTVVTVDRLGRPDVMDISKEPPQLIVVVDTQRPQVNVQPLPTSNGNMVIRCEVLDANMDTSKTHVHYQTADKVWRPLEPMSNQPELYCIPAQAAVTGLVRVSAADMADNKTTSEHNLHTVAQAKQVPQGQAASSLNTPGSTPVVVDHVTSPKVVQVSSVEQPTKVPQIGSASPGEASETLAMKLVPEITHPQAEKVEQIPIVKSGPIASQRPHEPFSLKLVNSTHNFLAYQIEQIGASGVGKVEIWMTRDQGQTWQLCGEDTDRKSPAEIDLPGDGLFGVKMVVCNGRGYGGAKPLPGTNPDWWIEVDRSKPKVDLIQVKPGVGEDAANLHITWSAFDKNLAADPVDIYYGQQREGPYHLIAKGMKSEGTYRWVVPADLGPQAFIRVAARDLAGNVNLAETAQAIPLDDLSRPRGRIIGVTPAPQGISE